MPNRRTPPSLKSGTRSRGRGSRRRGTRGRRHGRRRRGISSRDFIRIHQPSAHGSRIPAPAFGTGHVGRAPSAPLNSHGVTAAEVGDDQLLLGTVEVVSCPVFEHVDACCACRAPGDRQGDQKEHLGHGKPRSLELCPLSIPRACGLCGVVRAVLARQIPLALSGRSMISGWSKTSREASSFSRTSTQVLQSGAEFTCPIGHHRPGSVGVRDRADHRQRAPALFRQRAGASPPPRSQVLSSFQRGPL